MQRKRAVLYDSDYTQIKLTIPLSLHQRLSALKSVNKMRSIEAVIASLIRKAMAEYRPAQLTLTPPPTTDDAPKTIAVHIPRAQSEFLWTVSRHFRGVTLGVALEIIAAAVTDLAPAPVQLAMMEEDTP